MKLPTSISKWLASFKLDEYAESFQKAGYDTEDFLIGVSEDVSENAGSACLQTGGIHCKPCS